MGNLYNEEIIFLRNMVSSEISYAYASNTDFHQWATVWSADLYLNSLVAQAHFIYANVM